MKIKNCQHYSYDQSVYDLEWGDAGYFLENFKMDKDKINWLNFHSLSDRVSIERICYKHGVDKISVSEIFSKVKDPKLEEYNDYIFFSLQNNDASKITFIVGNDFLLTFQEKRSEIFSDVRDRISNKIGKIRDKKIDYLLFRMLHSIIDHYYKSMDAISKEVSALETELNYEKVESSSLKKIEALKRNLLETKKRIFPIKDIVAQIEKLDSFVEPENMKYFGELKYNCSDIIEDINDNKQILDGLVNLYYAIQGQKMNEIMKVLTIISTIFIPLTFIAGLYGMNFKFMPELESKWGYPGVLVVMVIVVLFLVRWFKKKNWL